MIRVLFVDDDLYLLRDLSDMLETIGAKWDMVLCTSGEDALAAMEDSSFDVIVADMKMPGMDGAELLTVVRDAYPQVMRVLMSGNADFGFTSRLVPQAQQFLHKPCRPQLVRSVVERAWELGQQLHDPELRKVVGTITDLPRPPASVLKLNALLDNPESDIDEVVDVVESDMALTVKLFQLVNSASYGLSRNIQEVREAVTYLGLATVRNLAVSVELFRSVSAASSPHGDAIQEIYDHSQQVASVARQLVLVREHANEAFVAGLLHDVGLLAIISHMPEKYELLLDSMNRSGLSLGDVEMDVIGAKHAALSAYLLNLWGLPFVVVEAVARHHDAITLPTRKMDPTHAVCVADSIVNMQNPDRPLREADDDALDREYLGELGVLERVAGLIAVGAHS